MKKFLTLAVLTLMCTLTFCGCGKSTETIRNNKETAYTTEETFSTTYAQHYTQQETVGIFSTNKENNEENTTASKHSVTSTTQTTTNNAFKSNKSNNTKTSQDNTLAFFDED